MVKDIAFTAYRITDMARARAFYEDRLGLRLESQWEDKWVEYSVGQGTFAIQNQMGEPSAHGGVVAFEVDDFARTFGDLQAAGVPVNVPAYESSVCWLAVVQDPDGNPVCIHQRKAPAAAPAP